MAIKYSLALRGNPADTDAEKKYYATAQSSKFISLDQLCEHIAQHGSLWTPDVVTGVVKKLVLCMEELLVDGATISLGNIGTFGVQITSRGEHDSKDFTVANIKKVTAVWRRGPLFKNLKNSKLGVSFEQVLSRKAQADYIKEYLEAQQNKQ